MTTKYFKCKLLTDVVLNSSLATEGNMQSLDFIPGSNFLGIVAKELYTEANKETFDIFHSEKVLFGDALISENDKLSYAMPFSLFQDKLENKITDTFWVHHKLSDFKRDEMPKHKNGDDRQLKQHRSGYLNTENKYIKKVEKSFSLKSAYNRAERRSDDGKMFGFDAIKKGQKFIFSVIFNDEKYIEKITEALIGKKRLGKSKTAQYGQVDINPIDKPETFESKDKIKNNKLVIYAESRLCFLDKEYGNPNFQPKPADFGIKKDDFTWNACQIRTGSYSPWNAKRNTPDSQRNFIERGSVFVIENVGEIDVDKLPKFVGEYQNEGFGHVIYNPDFLEYNENGIWNYSITEYEKEKINDVEKLPINSNLGKFLKAKSESDDKELEIGEKILAIFDYEVEHKKVLLSDNITKSQWGNIRTLATYSKDIDELKYKLFDKDNGYLTHGVADEKIWGKNNGKSRKALEKIIEENQELGTQFVAKFAAEIAKKHKDNEKK